MTNFKDDQKFSVEAGKSGGKANSPESKDAKTILMPPSKKEHQEWLDKYYELEQQVMGIDIFSLKPLERVKYYVMMKEFVTPKKVRQHAGPKEEGDNVLRPGQKTGT